MRKALKVALSATLLVAGSLALTPRYVDAGSCDGAAAPILIEVSASPGSAPIKPGSEVNLKAQVTNCSDTDWTGTVQIAVSGGSESWCISGLPPYEEAVTVKSSSSQSVEYKASQPSCLGGYTVTATAYSATVTVQDSDSFYVEMKTRRN